MKYTILLICCLSIIPFLHAEITPVPQREYLSTLTELVQRAQTSIEVEMYLIHSNSEEVRGLLDTLVEAEKGGVQVSMILEDKQEENRLSVDYLKDSGIDITFDAPDTKLHAKKVLIDGRTLLIGSSNWTKSAFTKNNESNVMVNLLEDRDNIRVLEKDYADTLIRAIDSAQEDIDIVIYSFQFLNDEDNKTYKLLASLLKAYDRGCRVRVVLDSWEEGESSNEPVYSLLEQTGVNVYYDLDTIASHNKLIIIDNKTVLLGSANWTEKSLTENREASILIRDPLTANAYTAYIDNLINELPEKENEILSIPVSFLKKGGLFQRLYRKGGSETIKLCCWFMLEASRKGSRTLKKDYKVYYEAIYEDPVLPWSTAKSARISNIIRRLEREGVIRREKTGKEITLLDLPGKGDDNILLPQELWTFGWMKKLYGSRLYFYLVNLAEFKRSPYKPAWINSIEKLSWKYGMGQRSISDASRELMAYNLIEIRHDIPDEGQPFTVRKANCYFINPLWSEDELEMKWQRLSKKHGTDLFLKARRLAKKINEPYDPLIVSSFISIIKIYGGEAVNKAVNTATALAFANGKWEMRYIIGILQKDYAPLEKP